MLGTLLKNYFFTKYRSFRSRERLENWQHHRVINHLQWVIQHSLFYRDLYHDLNLHDWRNFPIISKKEMMAHFNTLNTCKILQEDAYNIASGFEEKKLNHSAIRDITLGLSSGTSGNRGLFLVSPYERFCWAGAMLAKMLPSGLLTRQKIAFFFRTTSPLYNSIKSKTIQFEYYHLQDSLKEHIERLNHQRPCILVAPPSMLRKLAAEFKSGNLRINPRKIVSIAEVLDPVDERFISKVFNQKVHQIYQATEGFLATTCIHGTLHLNEDILVIQKERIPSNPSKFYPIITDFNRLSQPIIRYRLNDILHEREKPCPCGSLFTAIESIEGRSDDIFYFQNGQSLKPIFPDFIRRAVVTADPSIEEYFVVQTSPLDMRISLKTSIYDELIIQEKVRKKLVDLIQEHAAIVPNISFHSYEEHISSKKLRRIERKFRVEEDDDKNIGKS
jgi:putative adenylate-forming enzyme